MIELIIGSITLSLIHFLIPNHWMPLVSISRMEGWNTKSTIIITILTALSHTVSTISLGAVIGLIGFRLSDNYTFFSSVVAPLVLIFMGLVYFGMDLNHSHHDHFPSKKALTKKSKGAIVFSLCLAMFFSPCLEIETYFLTAGSFGWKGILVVSLIYLIVSVTGITLMVYFGRKGMERLKWHWLEHHEKKVTGSLLIFLGILSFFVST